MIRLSFAALTFASLASLVACTDATPYMQISDAPGAVALERDPLRDWSTMGGTTSVHAPGTATFPQNVTLRIEGRRADGGYDVNDPLTRAELGLVEGSACRISVPLSCMGGICFAELELTGPGLCQVRATGVTRDGLAVDDCWYRGTWEGDPADTAFAMQVQESAEAAHTSCLAISL
ncbi:MAG TPA: hypothetical protein VM261_01950 [Kofleriaceae bacterium]|nr:hypothetical protein [Kofleriaceae bacterium]